MRSGLLAARSLHAAPAFLALCTHAALAQVTEATPRRLLAVHVRDSLSRSSLPNVGLYRDSSTRLAVTDSTGIARVRLGGVGETRIIVRAIGFATKNVVVTGREEGDSLTVLLVRSADAQTLPVVDVRAPPNVGLSRYADYERRRTSGRTGIFITQAEIERQNSSNLLDIFRRYPSIKVVDSLGVQFVASARTPKPVIKPTRDDLAPCILRMLIDGVPLPPDFDLSQIQVRDVHGVEVYAGPASIPVELAGMVRDSQCGVVMVWTRIK